MAPRDCGTLAEDSAQPHQRQLRYRPVLAALTAQFQMPAAVQLEGDATDGKQKGEGKPVEQIVRLSKNEQERMVKQEMQAIAKEELSKLWMYRDKELKARAKEYFEMMKDPNWKLVSDNKGTQVWRLPGEKIHRIMGISEVNKPPVHCMEYFKDPHGVFTTLFPRIDTMFVSGKVLLTDTSRGHAVCQASFRMPMPVGNGAARGIPARDMLWEQLVAKLPSGNVLVSAKSMGPEKDKEIPPANGCVRGEILTSGYYGRSLGIVAQSNSIVKHNRHGRSKVWYIVQADPRGIIPKWLVNIASFKQASNVTRLAEMFEK